MPDLQKKKDNIVQ
jgi:dynein heavy chain